MKSLYSYIFEKLSDEYLDNITLEGRDGWYTLKLNVNGLSGELEFTSEIVSMPLNDNVVDKETAIEIQRVESNNKNSGIGTLLMKKCIEIAQENESDIYLYATPLVDNPNKSEIERLIKWYKKLGFIEIPEKEFDNDNIENINKKYCLVYRYK